MQKFKLFEHIDLPYAICFVVSLVLTVAFHLLQLAVIGNAEAEQLAHNTDPIGSVMLTISLVHIVELLAGLTLGFALLSVSRMRISRFPRFLLIGIPVLVVLLIVLSWMVVMSGAFSNVSASESFFVRATITIAGLSFFIPYYPAGLGLLCALGCARKKIPAAQASRKE